MVKEIRLLSSGLEFKAYEPSSKYYVNSKDLLGNKNYFKNKVNEQGFLVVRDVFDKKQLELLRDQYYSLFKEEYKKENNNWYQIKEPKEPHGYGNHPVKKYLKSSTFIQFTQNQDLQKIVSALLGCKQAFLSKRILVRSFSSMSTFTTPAHRDKEYYVSSKPSNVLTSWIPFSPADNEHGQLIYLEDSHEFLFEDNSKKERRKKIISKDLNQLALDKVSRWLIPEINLGDIIFHSLGIVHASFESNTIIPRLSCDLRFSSSVEYSDPRWNDYWYGEDGL